MFQLVTGDGGRLGHKLAIRTIYLIHSNRFRSKGELGHPQIQNGPVRGFACSIKNDATPKQIAAVKLNDNKGSHVWT